MTGDILDNDLIAQYQQARLSRDRRFDGTFFVAVKSTGIFCRPVCPARLPAEKNVRYYHLAAQAMHAGFRPCLRCRPDSAPHSSAWKGVNTTVQRATALLSELPVQPISAVAERLGISPRYLHKLITEKFGISPRLWQQYHQLMFAKQLLQGTILPVEQVAISAGFGSARRLQVAMKKYWGLTPSQVRGKKQAEGALTPSFTVFLAYRPPYHWPFVRDFLAARALPGTEQVSDDSYQRVFCHGHWQGKVTAKHMPSAGGFSVTVYINGLTGAKWIMDNLSRVLDLHADPTLINQALIAAGIPAKDVCSGLRLPGVWSAFEAGCRAVLGQQVSVKAAIALVTKLTDALGKHTEHGIAFPEPGAVANSALVFLKMPESRKHALRNLAHYFVQRQDATTPLSHQEADILALKGIGPWTLDYLLMRGESHPDRYLGGDLIIKKMAQQHGVNPHAAAPWRSYLTLQMWHMANQQKDKR
ncbi:DNA-3-methyladenine glycosylase 2 family protein [Alteromonas sp. 14N.309.X.WAT.G.H12]|uniref:DNA-3-methyladenine glycosylase 2 family protein n=1 Tax=Alteromonas sp. 14N.309.X.WAT.G.H12 TaxID=3120824 RepID=UPI002FD2E9EB